MPDATLKLCECGCGQAAPIANQTDNNRGYVQGRPMRFVLGHNGRRGARDRFESKVDRAPGHGPWGDCHVWTEGKGHGGYGRFCIEGETLWAHRVAWFLETGRWPTPCCLHRCDNPPCVRFDHLFEGTQADNMMDMATKGRRARPTAKLTEASVRTIRAAWPATTQKALATRYGISQSTISAIVTGTSWPDTTD